MSDYIDIEAVNNIIDWRVFTRQNGSLYVTILCPHNDGNNRGVIVLASTPVSYKRSTDNHLQMY